MTQKLSAADHDPNMKLKPVNSEGIEWFSPAEKPFRFFGFNWYDQDKLYRRFPDDPRRFPAPNTNVGNGAAIHSWNATGAQVAFRSNTTRIIVKVRLSGDGWMDHFAQTGSAGFDVYTSDISGRLRMAGVSRFKNYAREYTAEMRSFLTSEMRDFVIHFPLYSTVEFVYIGLSENCKIEKPKPWSNPNPIVVYGTSATQGGCVSRPGMAYTNILSRRMNMPVYNFGFSGSGCGEPEVAKMLAEIKKPSMYILDYEGNVTTAEKMRSSLTPFIDILRAKHPKTPILIVSAGGFGYDSQYFADGIDRYDYRQGFIDVYMAEIWRRRTSGDMNIHFLNGSILAGADWDETTVDGAHPTDLGFLRLAEVMRPKLENILLLSGQEINLTKHPYKL